MILAETSILIDALRPQFQAIRTRLRTEDAAICGVAKAEVLQGVRTTQQRSDVIAALSALTQLVIPENVWDELGDLLAALRAAGTPVPFPDVLQAAVAMEYGFPLWTKDGHFQFIRSVAPKLQLFVP